MPEPGPIVVAGSHVPGLLLHVDAIPAEGETVLAHGYEEPEDGGKASNQAIAAAKLGAPVRLITVVGNDERGRRWRERFVFYGVDTSGVVEVDGPTDVGFVLLPPSHVPAIASSVDRSAALDASLVRSVASTAVGASVVVCQLEAPQSCAIASFELARAMGATTILNPAPAAELDPGLVALTDILVPNEHEAALLAGSAQSTREVSRRLHEQYGCAVVVTAGRDGCYLSTDELDLHIPAPAVEVVDTTGAGDAFVGALATRLRTGDELAAACAFSVSAASLAVTRAGTIPSYPTSDELRLVQA